MGMSAPERMSQGNKKSFWEFIDALSSRQSKMLIRILQINVQMKDAMTDKELDIYKKKMMSEMLHINGVIK